MNIQNIDVFQIPTDRFDVEVHGSSTTLFCPSAIGRRLQITHRAPLPGSACQPDFTASVYAEKGLPMLVFAVSRLDECRVEAMRGVRNCLWVANAAFDLTPDELDRVIATFGPLGLRIEETRS